MVTRPWQSTWVQSWDGLQTADCHRLVTCARRARRSTTGTPIPFEKGARLSALPFEAGGAILSDNPQRWYGAGPPVVHLARRLLSVDTSFFSRNARENKMGPALSRSGSFKAADRLLRLASRRKLPSKDRESALTRVPPHLSRAHLVLAILGQRPVCLVGAKAHRHDIQEDWCWVAAQRSRSPHELLCCRATRVTRLQS